MESRELIAKELAEILKVIAHPDRVLLIEELRSGEKDVNALAETLSLPAARVSQHLALLRAHRVVEERREGRRHYYHLTQPQIAGWIVSGLDFITGLQAGVTKKTVNAVRRLWSVPSF